MGGTWSNAQGQNPKLMIYNDGTNIFGLGVSNGSFDFTTAVSSGFIIIGGRKAARMRWDLRLWASPN
jgi:hypothetical protein